VKITIFVVVILVSSISTKSQQCLNNEGVINKIEYIHKINTCVYFAI